MNAVNRNVTTYGISITNVDPFFFEVKFAVCKHLSLLHFISCTLSLLNWRFSCCFEELMFCLAVQYWYERFCYSAGTCFCCFLKDISHLYNWPKCKCALDVFWKIIFWSFLFWCVLMSRDYRFLKRDFGHFIVFIQW